MSGLSLMSMSPFKSSDVLSVAFSQNFDSVQFECQPRANIFTFNAFSRFLLQLLLLLLLLLLLFANAIAIVVVLVVVVVVVVVVVLTRVVERIHYHRNRQ